MKDINSHNHAKDLIKEYQNKLIKNLEKKFVESHPLVKEEDLNEASLNGFYKALDTYNPKMGKRFSGWATDHINFAHKNYAKSTDPISAKMRKEAAKFKPKADIPPVTNIPVPKRTTDE